MTGLYDVRQDPNLLRFGEWAWYVGLAYAMSRVLRFLVSMYFIARGWRFVLLLWFGARIWQVGFPFGTRCV